MKESVAVAKEADAKKGVSPTRSDNSILRLRDEPEMQLGSLRGVIDIIRRDGGRPSVESIATELSGMHKAQRASVLLALQRTHGNRYVQRVVTGIQAKLKVGQPNDIYEQEADRVADAVMQMQTKAGDDVLQTREVSRIQTLKSRGEPLSESARRFFEPRFGYDFSHVRVHTDSHAAESARAVNALAFTIGREIVFGEGRYAPETTSGRRLLAHELVHVVQQTGDNDPLTTKSTHVRASPETTGTIQRDDGGEEAAIADAVIAELDQPSPVAGFYSDYPAAFAILVPLPMSELLPVLSELHRRGYLRLIEGNESQAPRELHNRLLVGVTMVNIAEGSPSTLPSAEATASINGMTEGEREETWSFFRSESGDQDLVEGMIALSEPPTGMAGAVAGPPIIPLPWAPPGDQPIPFYIGNQAHIGIAASYVVAHIGEEVYTNFIPISTLLGHATRLGMTNNPALATAAQLALRPDIANLTRRHLYEIKPAASQALAVAEAGTYVAAFNAVGLPIILGPQNAPGTSGTIPAPVGYYIFWSPVPGAIVYQYGTIPPVRVRVPVRGQARSTSRAPDQSLMEQMAASIGLTGTALIIYLIFSEGSRLFPPRNLVPVP